MWRCLTQHPHLALPHPCARRQTVSSAAAGNMLSSQQQQQHSGHACQPFCPPPTTHPPPMPLLLQQHLQAPRAAAMPAPTAAQRSGPTAAGCASAPAASAPATAARSAWLHTGPPTALSALQRRRQRSEALGCGSGGSRSGSTASSCHMCLFNFCMHCPRCYPACLCVSYLNACALPRSCCMYVPSILRQVVQFATAGCCSSPPCPAFPHSHPAVCSQ